MFIFGIILIYELVSHQYRLTTHIHMKCTNPKNRLHVKYSEHPPKKYTCHYRMYYTFVMTRTVQEAYACDHTIRFAVYTLTRSKISLSSEYIRRGTRIQQLPFSERKLSSNHQSILEYLTSILL